MEAPLEVADAAEFVLAALAEVVMVLKTRDVLVVPSLDTRLAEVMTLVVSVSEVDVVEAGADVVVTLDTEADVDVVSEVVVDTSDEVVVVAGAEVSLVEVVVSAVEVEAGLAVELGTVLDVGVIAGAEDVDVACDEAAGAELVLMEVALLLLDIVNGLDSRCLDVFLV